MTSSTHKLTQTGAAVATLCLLLNGCGGGGGSDDTTSATLASAAAAPTSSSAPAVPKGATAASNPCEEMPPMPTVPDTGVLYVTDFGAKPDGGADDTAAIQRAVNALKPGQWLVFPPGVYTQSKSIWIKTPNVTIWSSGATLHATNPSDQALLLAADGVSLYNFKLTAVTQNRRTTPWESRIAVFDNVNNTYPTRNVTIRRNQILAGAPGTPNANGASAAGIFVHHAENFVIAENTVQRSLSDGIHMTDGTANGKVLNNFVHETGDDMISVVSYLGDGWLKTSPQVEKDRLRSPASRNLAHDILIANNEVGGNYWGRGISVVGGHDVTIRDNLIEDTAMGASVYIAREQGYMTYGVRNVVVKNNRINRTQVTTPVYAPNGLPRKTSQAAIEIYANVFDDEAAVPELRDELRVEHVQIEGNQIDTTYQNGIRVGLGVGDRERMSGTNELNQYVERWYTGANVGPVDISNNTMVRVGSNPAMRIIGQPLNSFCTNNLNAGGAATSEVCAPSPTPSPIEVTGAKLTCR